MTETILDTTLLSNFAHIQRPELLQAVLGSDAVTTATVLAELRAGVSLGWVPRCDWSWLAVVALNNEEQAQAAHYMAILDAGEAECLAIAKARGWVFASDDLAARRLAQHEGVAVSGTLGALQKLVAMQALTVAEADALLAVMVGRGYRAPVRSLRAL
jgi:predicted nucleic acid-binding protein